MSIGPKATIKRSCADCEVCQGERYTCQSDSGTDVYCAHPSLPVRRIIGDSRWDTPPWCPAEPEIAANADARIAELERDNERIDAQWREELRIYREAENARIAELEQAVAIRDTEIARLETDLELARIGARRYETARRMDPRMWADACKLNLFTGKHFDEIIDELQPFMFPHDAARAGNGGGV